MTSSHAADPRVDELILEFQAHWAAGAPDDKRLLAGRYPEIRDVVYRELVWAEYLCGWMYGDRREPVEVHLNRHAEYWPDRDLVLRLIDIEIGFGGNADRDQLVERFQSLEAELTQMFDGFAAADRHQSVRPLPLCHDPSSSVTTPYLADGPRPPDHGPLAPESVLCVQDRYRIMRLLTDGGQKYVYQAQQVNPGRVVALKTPRNPSTGESMRTEGQVIAWLDHQKIPTVMNLAEPDERNVQVILAEKFIPGVSWEHLLHGDPEEDPAPAGADVKRRDDGTYRDAADRNVGLERRLAATDPARDAAFKSTLRENLRYLLDVCDALAYAHADLQVIHRDLKPANVMLNRFNEKLNRFTEVYVIDWGLAVHVGGGQKKVPAPDRSGVASFAGTPRYGAPEMWHGVGEKLTVRTDVFLLGGILYEILTGTPPYVDNSRVLLEYKGKFAKVPQPEARAPGRPFPRELGQIAMKALAADPGDRHADAAEFAGAIEEYLRHADAEERRREADARLDRLEAEVASRGPGGSHDCITGFIEVADQFRQAGKSWEGGPASPPGDSDEYRAALDGERRARLALVDVTEQTGDFGLARSQLRLVAGLPAPFNTDVEPLVRRVEAKTAQRRRQRWYLRGTAAATFALLAGMVGVIVYAVGEGNRRTIADSLAQTEKDLRAKSDEGAELAQKAEREAQKAKEEALKAEAAANKLAAFEAKNREAQPWITKAGIHNDQRFQAGEAVKLAKALQIQPQLTDRATWATAVQRALVPVQWSSQRVMAACLAYDRDGKALVFGDKNDGLIRVYDLQSGKQKQSIPVHEQNPDSEFFGTVRKIVMHPGEPNLCFSIGQDGTVRCTDFVAGKVLATAKRPGDGKPVSLLGLDVAPTSAADQKTRLVTCDVQGNLGYWDAFWRKADKPGAPPEFVISLARTIPVARDKELLTSVAVHPRGNLIATGSFGKRILLHDPDGNLVAELGADLKDQPLTPVQDVRFSPDGSRLAAAGDGGTISVWDVPARKLIHRMTGHQPAPIPPMSEPRNRVWRVAFAPSGRLFSTGDDGRVREWDTTTGKEVPSADSRRHEATLSGPALAVPVAVRPDGREVASSGLDGRIRLWDAGTGQLRAETEGIVPGAMFSVTAAAHCPAKDLLITCGASLDGTIRAWDTRELKELRVYKPGPAPKWGSVEQWPTATAIDPDGSRFAVGLVNGQLHFFRTDQDDGKPQFTVDKAHAPANARIKDAMSGFAPAMFVTDWSRDGKQLITAGAFDQKLKVWDPATGTVVKEWSNVDPARPISKVEQLTGVPSHMTVALAFEPDGKHALTGTTDGLLYRWEVATGKLVQQWVASTGPVQRVAFSKEGKWAVTGGEEQVTLWDWTARKPARSIILPALVGVPQKAGKGIQQGFMQKAQGTVFGLALAPDTGHLVATQHDGSLSLIDLLSGAVLHRSLGSPYPDQQDAAFCFFTKGQEVLTADSGGLTRWDLGGGAGITRAEVEPFLLKGQAIAAAPNGKQWATRAFFGVTLWDQDPAAPPFAGAKMSEINPFTAAGWPTRESPPEKGAKNDKKEVSPDQPHVVAYTPDDRRLVLGTAQGSAVVWDRAAGKIHTVFEAPRPYRWPEGTRFTDPRAITVVAVDSTSRFAATNTQGSYQDANPLGKSDPPRSVVDVWGVEDGKLRTTLEWDGDRIATLAFRPGGKDLAALDTSGRVTVWDWETRKIRFSFGGAPGGGAVELGLAYAPDGSHLVQTGLGGDFLAANADDGKVIQRWVGHLATPLGNQPFGARTAYCLAFDKSGRLASSGSDGMVWFWDRDTDKNYQPTATVSTLRLSAYTAFGPEVEENPLLGRWELGIQPTRGDLHALVFAPGGKSVVTGGLATKVMVLPADAGPDTLAGAPPERTEELVGLRLDGRERLVPIERSRLIRRDGKK